jgi:hypothetical protein
VNTSERGGARRGSALVLLLLHLVVVGLAAFADGAVRAQVAGPSWVAEAAPAHGHGSCQFCRVLATELVAADPQSQVASLPAAWRAVALPVSAAAPAPAVLTARSRAPPLS